MNDPFDFFDRIYCINLARRTDRWARVSAEVSRLGLGERVERVVAVESSDRARSCRDSHAECVRRARAAGAKTVLVLEDDVVFSDDPRPLLRAALAELAAVNDWEAFYLGGQLIARVERKLTHIFRGTMVQAHAIALHERVFERVLQSTVPVDYWYAAHLRAYGVRPVLAHQATDQSDISVGVQNRRAIAQRSHWLYFDAPYPVYVAGRAFYGLRRRLGRSLVSHAERVGVQLRFDGMRPRIERHPLRG